MREAPTPNEWCAIPLHQTFAFLDVWTNANFGFLEFVGCQIYIFLLFWTLGFLDFLDFWNVAQLIVQRKLQNSKNKNKMQKSKLWILVQTPGNEKFQTLDFLSFGFLEFWGCLRF